MLKRRAELRKMRDLLFYHETKAERAALTLTLALALTLTLTLTRPSAPP